MGRVAKGFREITVLTTSGVAYTQVIQNINEGPEIKRMADQSETYEKILTANLQRAVDYLKFAETKNAALLAISSAWVVAGLNLECSGRTIPGILPLCIPIAMFCSLCAALLALISFLPRLHLPAFLGGKRAGPHAKNLLYFGDIRTVPIKTLVKELHSRYYPEASEPREEYFHDLIVQISVTSDIAMRKLLLFRFGIGFTLAAIVVLIVPVISATYGGTKGLW
jgi:Family of unknown function (DUF5706)